MSGIIKRELKKWATSSIEDIFSDFPTIYKKIDAEWRRLAGGLQIVHSRSERPRDLPRLRKGPNPPVRK